MTNGKFVISLDFELHWGFFDNRPLEECKIQLSHIDEVIDVLLRLSGEYKVHITFATVGMLFANTKEEIHTYAPDLKPNYTNPALDAYKLLDSISDENQKFYMAPHLIRKIREKGTHEIGTHTFSHYYCSEYGQSIEEFQADLTAAISIAKKSNIPLKSIVFPRNQVQQSYLKACEDVGLETYRGNCWFNFNNNPRKLKLIDYSLKILRMVDSYINISGSNSFLLADYNDKHYKLINIPASRFLRPYNSQMAFLEPMKIRRIKNAMTQAAKQNKVYHLWWHPHNFANNREDNFKNYLEIMQHYKKLKETYNFESITMQKLGEQFKSSL